MRMVANKQRRLSVIKIKIHNRELSVLLHWQMISRNETPWQKIDWWKATFPVELPLYCDVLTSAAGAVYTRLHRLCLF